MAKTKTSNRAEQGLDQMLAAAAASAPEPSEALLARVLADADAVLAERQAGQGTVPGGPRGWLGGLVDVIGGWPAMAGLATATVAGIWIGYAQPGSISGIADEALTTGTSYDLGDLMAAYDSVLVEG
ncbi:MAG: hypothetical protein WBN04_13035 [Paracoccaceae bacterium]